MYGPPDGRAWLAFGDDPSHEPAGAVGVRRFDEEAAEMKRMYVRPAYRGRGLGSGLAAVAVEGARDLGYRRILLDTTSAMRPAIAIYRALGFVETEPYRVNPLPDAVFMTLDLTRVRPAEARDA